MEEYISVTWRYRWRWRKGGFGLIRCDRSDLLPGSTLEVTTYIHSDNRYSIKVNIHSLSARCHNNVYPCSFPSGSNDVQKCICNGKVNTRSEWRIDWVDNQMLCEWTLYWNLLSQGHSHSDIFNILDRKHRGYCELLLSSWRRISCVVFQRNVSKDENSLEVLAIVRPIIDLTNGVAMI